LEAVVEVEVEEQVTGLGSRVTVRAACFVAGEYRGVEPLRHPKTACTAMINCGG
jgi:hypothetical protein